MTALRYPRSLTSRSRTGSWKLRASDTFAAVYVIVGLAFVQHPDGVTRTPIGERVEPFTSVWSLMYLVGGTLLLCGNRGYPPLRTAGLWLLIGGWAQNYVATLAVLGVDIRSLAYPVLITWALCTLHADRSAS